MNKKTARKHVSRWEECVEIVECDESTCPDFIECSEAMLFILHDSELLELLESE